MLQTVPWPCSYLDGLAVERALSPWGREVQANLVEGHPNLAEQNPLGGALQQGETAGPKPVPWRLTSGPNSMSTRFPTGRSKVNLPARWQPEGHWPAWSTVMGAGGLGLQRLAARLRADLGRCEV